MIKKLSALGACALGLITGPSLATGDDASGPGLLTGHVDVVNRYYVRGITTTYGNLKPGAGNKGADAPESDRITPQWGADYTHPSGFFLGYWASSVNYSYKQLGRSYDLRARGEQATGIDMLRDKSIENDFYGGYVGRLGNVSYTVGLTSYYYINDGHANANETKLGLAWGAFNVFAQTLLNDVVWGNRGDTYWSFNHSHPLPGGLTLSSSAGWYSYKKEGKYIGTTDTATGSPCAAGAAFIVNACVAGRAPVSDGFRHLIVSLSGPLGLKGTSWTLQGIVGGDNRFGINQAGKVVGMLSYGF